MPRVDRIVVRKQLRALLGAPKRQIEGLAQFAAGMMTRGKAIENGRIHNSVAALDYGASYYVAPTVEVEEGQGRADDSVSDGSGHWTDVVRGGDIPTYEGGILEVRTSVSYPDPVDPRLDIPQV